MDEQKTLPQEPPDRRGRAILVAILLLALVVAVRAGLRPAVEDGAPATGTVALLDGGALDLEALQGQVVLLDFWATWCAPCLESMPVVRAVGAAHADLGVRTIAVNTDVGGDREAKVRAFLARHGLEGLEVALDDGSLSAAWEVTGLPTLVVVGRDGVQAARHEGSLDEEELRALLARALD